MFFSLCTSFYKLYFWLLAIFARQEEDETAWTFLYSSALIELCQCPSKSGLSILSSQYLLFCFNDCINAESSPIGTEIIKNIT